MRRLLLTVAALFGLTAPLLTVSPARADFDLRVVWPTVSELNPDQSSYSITVSDTGPGTLQARWLGTTVNLAHNVTVALPLTGDGDGRVEIWRCLSGECAWAGVSSPQLRVHRSIDVFTADLTIGPSSQLTANISLTPVPKAGSITVNWRVVNGPAGDGTTLASGTQTLTPPSYAWTSQYPYQAELPIAIPPGLSEAGVYSWVVDVVEPFGSDSLSGTSPVRQVMIDETGPELVASASGDHVEPAVDGYLDYVDVQVSPMEMVVVSLDVYGPSGELVTQGTPQVLITGWGAVLRWSGAKGGNALPPGDYRLEVRERDVVGNESTASFAVSVGDGELTYRTWRSALLRPASGIEERSVGRCAALTIPSASGGAGSVGYSSDATCYHHNTDDNLVWTQYAIKVPDAFHHHYRELQIESQASARSGQRATLITGPVKANGKWIGSYVSVAKQMGWRRHTYPANGVVTQTSDGGVLTWRAGTNYRYRVDVKRFRLALEYQVLMHPDGSWEIPAVRLGESAVRAVPRGGRFA